MHTCKGEALSETRPQPFQNQWQPVTDAYKNKVYDAEAQNQEKLRAISASVAQTEQVESKKNAPTVVGRLRAGYYFLRAGALIVLGSVLYVAPDSGMGKRILHRNTENYAVSSTEQSYSSSAPRRGFSVLRSSPYFLFAWSGLYIYRGMKKLGKI